MSTTMAPFYANAIMVKIEEEKNSTNSNEPLSY